MRSKIFGLLTAFIFTLVLFVSLASAVILEDIDSNSIVEPPSVSHDVGSFNIVFNLTNSDNTEGSLNFSTSAITTGNAQITFDDQDIAADDTETITAKVTFPAHQLGSIAGTVSVLGQGMTSAPKSFPFLVEIIGYVPFCSTGAINHTDLTLNVDIDNKGEGEDEEWLPLDTIEIEVELENNQNEDLDDVVFELGLFKDGSVTNIIDDMIWISDDDEEVDVGDVDEDEDERHVFEFRVDPSEFERGNYVLKVKAYEDGKQDQTCIDFSDDLSDSDFGSSTDFEANIEIDRESDDEKMVVVDEEVFPTPIVAFCSEEVEVFADVYNIGDKDFLDQVKVTLYNKVLGIDLEEVLDGDLDKGEKARASFVFTVPVDAEEKQHTLQLRTHYDYDEDDEEYDEISEETFTAFLKVEGNCVVKYDLSVSAEVESGGKAGETLVVKATVTNTGTKTVNYVLDAVGYSTWANSADLSVTVLSLSPGESEVVSVTLDVKRNAFGNQNFVMEVLSGDDLAITQPVSVFVEKSDGFFGKITGSVVGFKTGDNWYVWVIGAVNVLLVMAIVFVVVRMLRRS